ncbi:MAG: hypothetical protein IJ397_04655 [Lachnospiraceae bacterium]|nr:hypothetical protein [Lachnospiraceae bacterium]
MKKLVAILVVAVSCIVMFTGCAVEEENIGGSSEVEVENSELSEVNSEEETESVQAEADVIMYSADEVMTHIDTLIGQFPYNNSEHIKALVIAANLDYIAEEDLNTLLSTYGYSIDELAVVYDECILDNAAALQKSVDYSQGDVNTLADVDTYANRITLETAMLNDYDKEIAKWYDDMMVNYSVGSAISDANKDLYHAMQNIDNNISSAERVMYTYTSGVCTNDITYYIEYLDNPFVNYSK